MGLYLTDDNIRDMLEEMRAITEALRDVAEAIRSHGEGITELEKSLDYLVDKLPAK